MQKENLIVVHSLQPVDDMASLTALCVIALTN